MRWYRMIAHLRLWRVGNPKFLAFLAGKLRIPLNNGGTCYPAGYTMVLALVPP